MALSFHDPIDPRAGGGDRRRRGQSVAITAEATHFAQAEADRQRSQLRRAIVSVLAVVLMGAPVGCTGGSDDGSAGSATGDTTSGNRTPTVETSDAGLRATVVQQRTDVGTRRIGLEVTTDHHTTLHVPGVQLLSDAFDERPPTPKDTDFTPNRTIDLTVNYGTPVCDPGIFVDDAQVLVHHEQDDTDLTAALPVAKLGRDPLANLHDAGCARQRLAAAAEFSYRTPFHRETVDGELVLAGELMLKRPNEGGSGERGVVESVSGSVLFQFEATDAPNVLALGQPSATVPVLIRGNNRCDPHARSASQQTFIFTVDVRVGSSALHREIIEPPTRLRVQAMTYLDDVC